MMGGFEGLQCCNTNLLNTCNEMSISETAKTLQGLLEDVAYWLYAYSAGLADSVTYFFIFFPLSSTNESAIGVTVIKKCSMKSALT